MHFLPVLGSPIFLVLRMLPKRRVSSTSKCWTDDKCSLPSLRNDKRGAALVVETRADLEAGRASMMTPEHLAPSWWSEVCLTIPHKIHWSLCSLKQNVYTSRWINLLANLVGRCYCRNQVFSHYGLFTTGRVLTLLDVSHVSLVLT